MNELLNKRKSLFRRVFIPMCILVGFIICFIVSIASYYDIFGEINGNSRSLFDQEVTNRAHYLENAMVSKWSNMGFEIERINQVTHDYIEKNHVSLKQLDHSSKDSQKLLKEISSELITLLRNRGTTGVYLMLSQGDFSGNKTHYYPGIYIVDNDPESKYESSNSDLLLTRCPVELVDDLGISMDSNWQPSFEFTKDDLEFYDDIFKNFDLSAKDDDITISDVGRWIPPYQRYGSDTYSISYILPLIYNKHVYGAIGIDVSFAYLQKLLPYHELDKDDKAGYILALQQDDTHYQTLFVSGPYYSSSIKQFSTLDIPNDRVKYIRENVYCSPYPLKLYNSNTPYSHEKWVLMGIVDKSQLYGFTEHLGTIFSIAMFIILGIGTLLSYILTRYITHPIVDLANHISQTSGAISRVNLERTHIIEIDQLIEAIEKMGNDVLASASRFTNIIELANTKLAGFELDYVRNELFITDGFFDIFLLHDINTKNLTVEQFKKIFKMFDSVCQPTTKHNECIYHITSQGEQIYLRLRYHETSEKCVGLVEEISDMIKERQVIEHERDHDVLTGLVNRRAFQRQMKRLFSIEMEHLKIAALVMMDLDNLKSINDKYGHDCGDSYIKATADIFARYSPKNTIVSRTSGDEFYLFYYGYNSKDEINHHLQELKNAIAVSTVVLPNGERVRVHVSGGVAWYPQDSTQFEELQRYSDFAMYTVKHTVKGEIGTFDFEEYENNAIIMKKRMDFHELIDQNRLIYYFQPIVDIKTGKVFGYEALMRSTRPVLKNPKDILSIAKLEAQLNNIEILTWKKALESYQTLSLKGQVQKEHKVFINSISNQFIPDADVSIIEEQYGSILDKVVLEVTEDEENNDDCFSKKSAVLKRWHAQVALDDYGSGYNSERNLLMVDPAYVKINMDIIRDIDKEPDKQKIVENIVSYCHERNKKVIAEGVETVLELALVYHLKVDYVQGFLFAKPEQMPPDINEEALMVLRELNK